MGWMPQPKDKDWLMDTKTRPLYMLSTRDPPQNKRHIQTESEGLEKDISHKWRPKESRSQIRSDQISCLVMSNSLRPHESQHARPPCPSPTPGVHWDSCPSSQWCHPAISSSVIPFSSCPNPSQHQSLLQWVNSSHEVAKVLEFQL